MARFLKKCRAFLAAAGGSGEGQEGKEGQEAAGAEETQARTRTRTVRAPKTLSRFCRRSRKCFLLPPHFCT